MVDEIKEELKNEQLSKEIMVEKLFKSNFSNQKIADELDLSVYQVQKIIMSLKLTRESRQDIPITQEYLEGIKDKLGELYRLGYTSKQIALELNRHHSIATVFLYATGITQNKHLDSMLDVAEEYLCNPNNKASLLNRYLDIKHSEAEYLRVKLIYQGRISKVHKDVLKHQRELIAIDFANGMNINEIFVKYNTNPSKLIPIFSYKQDEYTEIIEVLAESISDSTHLQTMIVDKNFDNLLKLRLECNSYSELARSIDTNLNYTQLITYIRIISREFNRYVDNNRTALSKETIHTLITGELYHGYDERYDKLIIKIKSNKQLSMIDTKFIKARVNTFKKSGIEMNEKLKELVILLRDITEWEL